MGQTATSGRRDPSTTKVHLYSSQHGPGQKGRMGIQGLPQNKEKKIILGFNVVMDAMMTLKKRMYYSHFALLILLTDVTSLSYLLCRER